MKTVDARGLACPQPVVLARKAVLDDPAGAVIIVDNACSVENIGRFAANSGYSVESAAEGPDFRLTLKKL